MNINKQKYDNLIKEAAKKYMVNFDLTAFKISHKRLYLTIVEAIRLSEITPQTQNKAQD